MENLQVGNLTRYKTRAFAESQELELGLLETAHTPVEQALARMAGTLMLAVRTWHWRRVARRKVRAGESEELAAHSNALQRLLERFDKRDDTATPQTSGPTPTLQPAQAQRPGCSCVSLGPACQYCLDKAAAARAAQEQKQ